MQSSRFQSIAARFSPRGIRTSFRRSSSVSSTASTDRNSYLSQAESPISVINSVISRQQSIMDLEEERKIFASELNILEPRPVLYFGSLEERMESL